MLRTVDHLLKPFGIVLVIGAHETVPEVEVEAVVGVEDFVMLMVMGIGIEEIGERAAHEPFGKNLVAAVAKDAEEMAVDAKRNQCDRIEWNKHNHDRHDPSLDESLGDAEGVSGPRCGVR